MPKLNDILGKLIVVEPTDDLRDACMAGYHALNDRISGLSATDPKFQSGYMLAQELYMLAHEIDVALYGEFPND